MKTKTRTTETARERGDWQGMKWIRSDKRLAIYLRDGLACAWCGTGVESGALFTLDHLKPHSSGGSNDESNLVTCCSHCNTSRGKRGQSVFARAVAGYVDRGAADILGHVRTTARRSLKPFIAQAREIIEQRGGYSSAMKHLSNNLYGSQK